MVKEKEFRSSLLPNTQKIEKLIRSYGFSLKDLPSPTKEDYAYEACDRIKASIIAAEWQNEHYDRYYDAAAKSDYICYQADVIEMLVKSLMWANNRLAGK